MSNVHTIEVKGGEWLNSNDRRNRYRQAALVSEWRTNAGIAAAGLLPMQRVHIFVHLVFPDHKRRDPGNWYPTAKAIVDGLVDAEILPDDSEKHVIGPDMRAHPERRKTVWPTVIVAIVDVSDEVVSTDA